MKLTLDDPNLVVCKTTAEIMQTDYPEIWERVIQFESALRKQQETIIALLPDAHKKLPIDTKQLQELEEQNNFLTKYLVIQPILITVLFISIFLITLGIIVKYREGIICSLIGLILLVIVLDVVMLLSNVKKTLKSKKSKVVDDAIATYSVFNNLQIIERAILSLTLIALIVMSFNAITNNQKIVLNIILIILSFAYYGYNLYVSIRCLNKFKGAKYKV